MVLRGVRVQDGEGEKALPGEPYSKKQMRIKTCFLPAYLNSFLEYKYNPRWHCLNTTYLEVRPTASVGRAAWSPWPDVFSRAVKG